MSIFDTLNSRREIGTGVVELRQDGKTYRVDLESRTDGKTLVKDWNINRRALSKSLLEKVDSVNGSQTTCRIFFNRTSYAGFVTVEEV